MEEISPKITFKQVVSSALDYWNQHRLMMVGASVVLMVFLEVGFCLLGGWSNPFFLLWAVLFYLFWFAFYRFMFERQPYLKCGRLWESLIPATKIFMLAFMLATLLLLLPYAPYAMNVPVEVKENYELFQKRYMQDGDAYDLFLNVIFVFIAPQIILRPFMAWISAVIGRSWSIMTAWNRTQGSYFVLFVVMVLINIFYLVFSFLISCGLPLFVVWILAAPLILFVNVLVARGVYDFYFL